MYTDFGLSLYLDPELSAPGATAMDKFTESSL